MPRFSQTESMATESEWIIRMSSSRKRPYFYNNVTKESSWEAPPGMSEDDITRLPGIEFLSTPTEEDTAQPGKVKASHLLVKHAGSRRPSSWKEPTITRSKEEAISILRGYQSELHKAGPLLSDSFKKLAYENSDCSSHEKGGDLGWFGPGQMQKPFEEAAFALKPSEMSDIVSTDSGVHLILRVA